MSILETSSDRLLLLIEQFRLSLKSKDTIESTIKKTAVFNREFDFLQEIDERGKTAGLDDNIRQQLEKESSKNVKAFLSALTARELAAQKLEELKVSMINEKKAEFDRLLSVGAKIGWIAAIMMIPLFISFFSSLSEVFAVAGIELTVSETTKVIVTIGCAVLISYFLFSKRRRK